MTEAGDRAARLLFYRQLRAIERAHRDAQACALIGVPHAMLRDVMRAITLPIYNVEPDGYVQYGVANGPVFHVFAYDVIVIATVPQPIYDHMLFVMLPADVMLPLLPLLVPHGTCTVIHPED